MPKPKLGFQASNILRRDKSVVDIFVDELVGGVGGVIGHLNFVVDLVVHLPIGTFCLRDEMVWDAAQVGFDFDELCHASYCDVSQLVSRI